MIRAFNHEFLLVKVGVDEALAMEREEDVRRERELAVSELNLADLPMAALATRNSQGFKEFMVMRNRECQRQAQRMVDNAARWTRQ